MPIRTQSTWRAQAIQRANAQTRPRTGGASGGWTKPSDDDAARRRRKRERLRRERRLRAREAQRQLQDLQKEDRESGWGLRKLFRRSPLLGALAPSSIGVETALQVDIANQKLISESPLVAPELRDPIGDFQRGRALMPVTPGEIVQADVSPSEVVWEAHPDARVAPTPLRRPLPERFRRPLSVQEFQSHRLQGAFDPLVLEPILPNYQWPEAVPEVVPEVELDFSLPRSPGQGPRVRMRIKNQPRPRAVRAERNRPRDDQKKRGLYVALLHFINVTWGTFSEIADAYQALLWNTYLNDGTPAARAFGTRWGQAHRTIEAIARGRAYVELDDFLQDFAVMQISDHLTAKLGRYQDSYGVFNRATQAGLQRFQKEQPHVQPPS